MKKLIILLLFLIPNELLAAPSISPLLYLEKQEMERQAAKSAQDSESMTINVTVRFIETPDTAVLTECEDHGLVFSRYNGKILHTKNIYPAKLDLEKLEYFERFDAIMRIETSKKIMSMNPLHKTVPETQAPMVWEGFGENSAIDGSGVIVADVDVIIDIFHPGLFKPDGGSFNWLDSNGNGIFDPGTDCVDLNKDGESDSDEHLNFYDAYVSDRHGILECTKGVFDLDFDWLYNDNNLNGVRDYGPDAGFTENDSTYGELVFFVDDTNANGILDTGETLTALGSSRILSIIDDGRVFQRGKDLFECEFGNDLHSTAVASVLCGQASGRRLTGIAPGVDMIIIKDNGETPEEDILIARELGADIFMYEFVVTIGDFNDGTSNLEMLISDLNRENLPQFTATGNNADSEKHAFITVQGEEEKRVDITVQDSGLNEIWLSIGWMGQEFDPKLSLVLPDNTEYELPFDLEFHNFGDYVIYSGSDVSPKGTNGRLVILKSGTDIIGDMSV